MDRKFKQKNGFFWAGIALGLAVLVGCSLKAVQKDREKGMGDGELKSSQSSVEAPLREALETDRSGLYLLPPDSLQALLDEADWVVGFRKAARNKSEDQLLRAAACQENPAISPFCPVLAIKQGNKARRNLIKKNRPRVKEWITALKKADLTLLSTAKEADLIAALGKVKDEDSLGPVVQGALESEVCPSTAVLTTLGMKLETVFPDNAARETALQLFAKSQDCGTDYSAQRAGYRLALIHIWDSRFKEARLSLQRVLAGGELPPDVRLRVLYWSHYSAARLGMAEEAQSFRAQLVKEFPFSLHAISTSPMGPDYPTGVDHTIRFASETVPELNPALRSVEALQRTEHFELSRELLAGILEKAKLAEPQVQLYVAILLSRSGDFLSKFQFLANLFRIHPHLVSEMSLRLMFPAARLETVKRHDSYGDPFLILSLIRQESAFNERARSHANARGLMQLLPSTARRVAAVSSRKLFEPETNVRVGIKYFAQLLKRYEGKPELALAAYNAGPRPVDDWLRRYPVENGLLFIDLFPYRETREYVAAIARNYYWYLRLYERESLFQRREGQLFPFSMQVYATES